MAVDLFPGWPSVSILRIDEDEWLTLRTFISSIARYVDIKTTWRV